MHVYLWHPSDVRTGGTTALDQLAVGLRAAGAEVTLVDPQPTFRRFGLAGYRAWHRAQGLPDLQPADAVVAPEKWAWQLADLTGCRRVLWWLSVDNAYLPLLPARDRWFDRLGSDVALKRLVRPVELPLDLRLRSQRMIHCVQSEYARVHVQQRFHQEPLWLTDYLEDEFLSARSDGDSRARRVLYNPVKGPQAVRRVMAAAAPDIEFRALRGLSGDQARALMSSSALYLDLGSHPGRDRMPRETAMMGCQVVVGLRGSACNDVDVPLPADLKVPVPADARGARLVADRVTALLDDRTAGQEAMASYRAWVLGQRAAFLGEAAQLAAVLREGAA